MAIRLQDIADDLNLSKMTISKVLRGQTDVSAETKARVLKRMKELNYRPTARGLRTGQTYVLLSIVTVASLYLEMNLATLGLLPWREAEHSKAIVADFMRLALGPSAAKAVSLLILIASWGSAYAILLGYSRIPYAAAVNGRFPKIFARVHPTQHFPTVSLLYMGIASAFMCVFSLADLISALIIIQTLLQTIGQCIAVILLRRSSPPGVFRMPFFPLPALAALAGWVFIIVTSEACRCWSRSCRSRRWFLSHHRSQAEGVAFQAGMMYDVTVIGEIYLDHVFSGFADWPGPGEEIFTDQYAWELGGGAVATACALSRLGRGVQLIGIVGEDQFPMIEARLATFGVSTTNLTRTSERSGVTISISTTKDRSFFTYRGANQQLSQLLCSNSALLDIAALAKHVHLAMPLTPQDGYTILPALKRKDATISIDVGHHVKWLEDTRNLEIVRTIDYVMPDRADE